MTVGSALAIMAIVAVPIYSMIAENVTSVGVLACLAFAFCSILLVTSIYHE